MASGAKGKRRLTGDVLLVVVTVAALVVAAGLLHQVAQEAGAINDHADDIAANTEDINKDTNAIYLLNHTNELASSILDSAKPLSGELGRTVEIATNINGEAKSIQGEARSIRGSAGAINQTAAGIEDHANGILSTAQVIRTTATDIAGTSAGINSISAAILQTAKLVNNDVKKININANKVISSIRAIRGGTQKLVAAGLITHKEAACIDKEINLLFESSYNGGDFCRYEPGGGND